MYHLLLIVGSVILVIGLIFLRIVCSPDLHPDAQLFVRPLSMNFSNEG